MVVQSLTIQHMVKSRPTMSFQPTLDQPRHLNLIAILPTILQSVANQYLDSHATGMAGDAIVTRLEKNQSTQKSRPTMLFRPTLAQPRHLKQAAILLNVVMHKGDSHATGMAGNAIVTLLKRHQFTPRSRQTMSFQPTLDQPRHLNQTAILPNAAMHIQELPATGMAGHATVILLKKNHLNFLVLQRK